MKKLFCLALVLVLVLSLCACGTSEGAAKSGLEVGFGRANITPDYPMNIAGGAATISSEGYLDPIYITFIALRQGEQTYLVATMDLVGAYEEYSEPARNFVSQETGLPKEHIILNSTHTHSSVSIRNADSQNCEKFRVFFYESAITAAKDAIADLSPAQVWTGSTMTEGMVWVRHYEMKDGTFAGANYGSFSSGIVGHVYDPDPELQMIKFERPAEDKQDIVLMTFPAHATMQKELMLSADFPGPARAYIEDNTDTLVAYFIAGAGDQTPTSRVSSEQFSSDYAVYGEELGRIAVECMKTMTQAESGDIRFCQRTFTANTNKEDLDRLPDAQAVQLIWNQVGGRGTDAGKKAAKEHGFNSVYEVTAILNRSKFADTRSMDLTTLAIGDVSLIFAPYEMFGANARQIKEGSPYDMTFIVTCSQNHDGYLPSAKGWEIYCYEAQITRYAPGTAELLAQEYIDMLTEMKTPAAEEAE